MSEKTERPARSIAILGGGPGGYEAATVAARLGADVTIIERQGMGGSAVLTDVVPSKTLIAAADVMTRVGEAEALGVHLGSLEADCDPADAVRADLAEVNERLLNLARNQSADIKKGLEALGVRVILGSGRITAPGTIDVITGDDEGRPATETVTADTILIATGAHPRELPTAVPDGKRILNWTQVYNLEELPGKLIVIGSGVTGAEFASAYTGLGVDVTLISSRDRVLPGEDADAAEVLEEVLQRRGMTVIPRSRAEAVENTGDGVRVTLDGGRTVEGTHCIVAVGSIPNTAGIGLEELGIETTESGHIVVDGVSRTNVPGVYAAGDCTGVLPLASVAAMQGRIAMAHLMGDYVTPLRLGTVASNIFTSPEIASVGVGENAVESGEVQGDVYKLPLSGNARAKMMEVKDGFVKLVARKDSGTVIGGVVVGPRASELIYPIALAVTHKMNVIDLADTFTVYPSLSGSISEAARRLHRKQ